MRINDIELSAFIEIYREEFGEKVSRSDASEMAFRLVTLYEGLAKRLPSDADHKSLDNMRRRPIGFRV